MIRIVTALFLKETLASAANDADLVMEENKIAALQAETDANPRSRKIHCIPEREPRVIINRGLPSAKCECLTSAIFRGNHSLLFIRKVNF